MEGVLCDGPSPENIASTVVDCTKIDTGHIGFFRVGLITKSKVTKYNRTVVFIQSHLLYVHTNTACICVSAWKVLQIFEEVQRQHRQGQTNPVFEDDLNLPDTQDRSSRGETDSTTPSTVSYEQSLDLRNRS